MACNGCGKRAKRWILEPLGYQLKDGIWIGPKGDKILDEEVMQHHTRESAKALWKLLRMGVTNRSLVALLLLGCAITVEPTNWIPLQPPPEYAVAWQAVMRCLDITGDMERIQFRVVQQEPWTDGCPRDYPCTGMWLKPHTIYLGRSYVMSRRTVQHEMIHDGLGEYHNDGNEAVFDRCDYPDQGFVWQ